MDRVKKFLQEYGSVVVICALAVMLAFQGITSAVTNERVSAQARTFLPTACAAVKQSDDAIEALLTKQVKLIPAGVERDKFTKFNLALHDAFLTAQVKCLIGGK